MTARAPTTALFIWEKGIHKSRYLLKHFKTHTGGIITADIESFK